MFVQQIHNLLSHSSIRVLSLKKIDFDIDIDVDVDI